MNTARFARMPVVCELDQCSELVATFNLMEPNMSNKAFALAAFNTAVVVTNAAHATKRGVVAAASFTKDTATTGAVSTKEAGVAFWAGMKYANQYNKATGSAASRLSAKDIAPKSRAVCRVLAAAK